jgi:flavin reductase (DIM6/NTAB) family NADH-FMN oxidoreductase RutF
MQANQYITNSVLDSAVALLIVETGARRNAMTISFFSEVAHFPAALWVSVARTSYSYELLQESATFSLAVLNQKQRAIALSCGNTSGRSTDKCKSLRLYKSEGGFLFLEDAIASTGAKIRESAEIGDHTLFVADIVESHFSTKASRFRHLLLSDLTD